MIRYVTDEATLFETMLVVDRLDHTTITVPRTGNAIFVMRLWGKRTSTWQRDSCVVGLNLAVVATLINRLHSMVERAGQSEALATLTAGLDERIANRGPGEPLFPDDEP